MRTDRHSPASAWARLRTAFARMIGAVSRPGRGLGFWLVTALLGLVLPAPVAVVVVAARLRRNGAGGPAGSPGG